MSAPNAQRGVAPQRVDFARENYLGGGEFGVTPSDPSFLKYSDAINSVTHTPGAVLERRGGLGTADPVDFQRGPESSELTVNYDLVKWIGSASGDAAYDGLERQGDNLLPDSHSILVREDKTHVNSGATLSGNTARPTRLYTYGRGGLINEGAITGDPSEQQPVVVELTYLFQYLRGFQIDQPTSGEGQTHLTVRSTDSSDTNISVTIEDEGAATTEDVSTDSNDGTTVVSTTSQFGDVDAIYVSESNTGDIVVSINTGDDTSPTEGDEIARIHGTGTYNGVESDYGVPPLGSGSRETTASLGDVETFIGDQIQKDSSDYANELQTTSLAFENNIETTETNSQFGMSHLPGNRNIMFETTEFGEAAEVDFLWDHMQNTARNFDWTMDGGTVTLSNCRLVEPGEVAKEEGQAVLTVENAWTAEGISFS